MCRDREILCHAKTNMKYPLNGCSEQSNSKMGIRIVARVQSNELKAKALKKKRSEHEVGVSIEKWKL